MVCKQTKRNNPLGKKKQKEILYFFARLSKILYP